MTTTAFAPTTRSVFGFQATLDGGLYNVAVTWNVSRGGDGVSGWFFNVYDQSNNLIVASPLVGSPLPPQRGVNLVAGYFTTSAMYFYPASQTFVVAP